MIDANTIEGMEQSPPNVTLEANVVWDNLERILSPNYELNGEKLKKPENAPKLETKNMLDYFDEPFSPTDGEKICSSKLKKSGKFPKLETKDVLDYFDEPFSPTKGEKLCSSKLKKPVKSPNKMVSDEEREAHEIGCKWPSFSGMEPVTQNCIASVTNIDDTIEDREQSFGHEGGGNLRRYFQFGPILKQMYKIPSLNISFFKHLLHLEQLRII